MFAHNLKFLRESRGLSQRKLAEELHVSQQTVGSWEVGRTTPSPEMITTIASLFVVSVDQLLGHKPEKAVREYREISRNRIPVYGNIAAGIPIEAITDYDPDNADDWEEISEDLARNGAHIALRIKGNSMEPRMRTGDVVIVRVQPDVENGDIAAVRVNGDEVTCKKISKTDDGIMLIPLNPDYETKFYSAEQITVLPVCIIGKVVELRAKF
ncbi:MAG: helix-turn-helix domain-containing protein [Clostridia bacterium]|nr:helix-turn-helix domain-containing protein [Clostridia bacterium]